MTKRSKLRRTLGLISLLLFPITLNFFSPYVSVTGAFFGVISGSVLTFFFMFLTGIVFRRAWCSYVCPMVGLSEYAERINDKTVNRKRLGRIRITIFAVWFITLITGFVIAHRLPTIDVFFMTESGISVDIPIKYITYYMVLGLLVVLTLTLGKRGACQSVCWMSPFLVAGSWVGEKLHLPQYQVISNPEKCISCKLCNKACPMSIDVMDELKKGRIATHDCINCGQCEDVCPKDVLKVKFK